MSDLSVQIFTQLITIPNLLIAVGSVFLGIIIGCIPGLTVTLGIILFVPLTYGMNTITAFIGLLGIYVGGCYGGSISAILINTPGTNSALATTLDGYPMAQAGRKNKALSISLFSSVLGGFLAALVLLLAAPPIAKVALKFRSPEYFSLAIFGMTVIAGVSNDNIVKGLMSAAVGLFISFLGLESLSGTLRYTFDTILLFAGVGLLPALIGFIALNQVIIKAVSYRVEMEQANAPVDNNLRDPSLSIKEMLRLIPTIIKSTIIAIIIGVMPGAGGDIASFVAYNEARRSSKHPERFGKGASEGVASAESANNAVVGSALIPLLTLGIPGDGVTAVLLGAFILHGLVPGPKLFTDQAVITYSIIIGLIFCNLILYVLGRLFTKQVAKVINLPYGVLGICIVIFCFAGAFANSGNINEMFLIVPIAILAYMMNLFGFSVVPTMLGLILGPILEENFTRSMIVSDGKLSVFFTEPISCGILIFSVVFTYLVMRMNKKMAISH